MLNSWDCLFLNAFFLLFLFLLLLFGVSVGGPHFSGNFPPVYNTQMTLFPSGRTLPVTRFLV